MRAGEIACCKCEPPTPGCASTHHMLCLLRCFGSHNTSRNAKPLMLLASRFLIMVIMRCSVQHSYRRLTYARPHQAPDLPPRLSPAPPTRHDLGAGRHNPLPTLAPRVPMPSMRRRAARRVCGRASRRRLIRRSVRGDRLVAAGMSEPNRFGRQPGGEGADPTPTPN